MSDYKGKDLILSPDELNNAFIECRTWGNQFRLANHIGGLNARVALLEGVVAGLVDKYDSMQDGNIGAQFTPGDFFAARAALAKTRGEA